MPRRNPRVRVGNKRYALGRTEPKASFSFATATIGAAYMTGTNEYKRDLTENGSSPTGNSTYLIFTEIDPALVSATLDATHPYPGTTKSLRTQQIFNDQRQKNYLRTNDEFIRRVTWEMDCYMGFGFYLETTAGSNDFTTYPVNFSQMHQYNSGANTTPDQGPPINVRHMAPGGGFLAGELGCYYKYDGFQSPYQRLSPDGPIAKGVWHHMIWHARPSRVANGIVEVWLNGRQVYNSGGGHNLAYATDNDRVYPDGTMFNVFDCGLYRTTPVEMKPPTDVYYAWVKLGPTYQSVLPG